jgi:GT2 family glycosyltransferase
MTTTVILVTHNSAALISPVLDALESDPAAPEEVVVVDSGSTDETLALLAERGVVTIPANGNIGFAAACHRGVDSSTGDVVVFLGHDAVPSPGWLPPLVTALDSPGVAASMATLEDADNPGHFNTSGGRLTYFGIAWVSDSGSAIPAEAMSSIEVAFPSGAAMAMTRANWDRFGGFRKEFFMYHEDSDLGWRIRLAGLRSVRVPSSRVAHHYDFSRSPRKMYYLERNRWLMLRSNYRRRTLLVLAPALALVEAGTLIVSIRDGWWREKLRAMRDATTTGAPIREFRRVTTRNRKLGDAQMIASMDRGLASIPMISAPSGTAIVDALLAGWATVALPLVRLLDRMG